MLNLYNGCCFDFMADMKDRSIGLIVTDPPYFMRKAKWDTFKSRDIYNDFMFNTFKEVARILKPAGSFWFFHNDMNFIAEFQLWIRENTKLQLRNFITWDKGYILKNVWDNPQNNFLRSFHPVTEYILYYTFKDDISSNVAVHGNPDCYLSIKEYLRSERRKVMEQYGFKTAKQFRLYMYELTGVHYSHERHHFSDSQWSFPAKRVYNGMQKSGFFSKSYDELKAEYDCYNAKYNGMKAGVDAMRYVHNNAPDHRNVWQHNFQYDKDNPHPTPKPLAVMDRIIYTSSNPGFTVFDPFTGSGSTGVSAIRHGCNFIGCEKEQIYYEYAKKRIEEAVVGTLNKKRC